MKEKERWWLINRVILTGNVTKDLELRNMGDGKAVTKFSLAVKRTIGEETDFIGCTAFGQTAELLKKSVGKGSKILIEGRIQTGSYTNAEGKKVYTTDVIVDRIEFLDSKKTTPTDNRTSSEIIRDVVTNADNGPELPF